jgi:hypothetical protein
MSRLGWVNSLTFRRLAIRCRGIRKYGRAAHFVHLPAHLVFITKQPRPTGADPRTFSPQLPAILEEMMRGLSPLYRQKWVRHTREPLGFPTEGLCKSQLGSHHIRDRRIN